MRRALRHKKFFITGGSSGLGEALAYSLAQREAVLVLGARRTQELERVAKHCTKLGAAHVFTSALDVSSGVSVKRFCKFGLKKANGADGLINNAGIHAFARVEEMDSDLLQKTFETNTFGPLRMIQQLLPALEQTSGLIVQISSSLAWRALPAAGAYAASKAALDRLSEALRDETSSVKVLEVHPGVVTTSLRDHASYRGLKPNKEGLLFTASAEKTAQKIVTAIEKGSSRLETAPLPVRMALQWLPRLWPSLVDAKIKGKDARKP